MNVPKKIIISFLLTIISSNIYSQHFSNIRKKTFQYADTIVIDTLSTIHGSINLLDSKGQQISTDSYFFDNIKSTLILKDTTFSKIFVEYKVFPFYFEQTTFNKDTSLIVSKLENYQNNVKYSVDESFEDFIPSQSIDKQGNISRGVSFGNNQDLSLNSNLNLQLSGKINEDVSVIASISDDNIPIQAEGNTQQVQDFDKIFISVYNNKNKLTVGDYQVFKPKGYFINYSKKLKGINYEIDSSKILKKLELKKNQTGVAISKGKYNRVKLDGIEANQGPYKLQGVNNEAFIIILSNSEKVYIDGELLTRGENNDYTINYNSAEITFTAKQLITKNKRITVEFEYSEKNYTRFLFYNSTQIETNKGDFYMNLYSESDAKNQPIQQELSDEQKLILYNIGDSLNLATYQNADSVEFNIERILYKKIDTLIETIIFNDIYIYSQNKDNAFYQVAFSYVGSNKGDYKIKSNNANGRVYEWVSPVDNIAQGDYQAISYIVAPKQKQVYSFGGDVDLTKNTIFNFEISMSNNDINTFSDKHSGDNNGFATKTSLKQYFIGNDTSSIKFSSSINYMFVGLNYDAIDFYKNIEFDRNWNIEPDNDTKINENIFNFNTNYQLNNLLNINYDLSKMNRSNDFNGLNNNLITSFDYKKYKLNIDAGYLTTSNNLNKTVFFKNKISLSKTIKFIEIGAKYEIENNKWNNSVTDSLLDNSFAFNQYSVFIKTSDTLVNNFTASYKRRFDYLLVNNSLTINNFSDDYSFVANTKLLKSNNSSFHITYRKLNIIDTSLVEQEPENTLVGSFNFRQNLLKKIIKFSTAYEVGSGLERKNEFSYLEVTTGEGIYKWIDFNNNGNKELNEFEIANFQDEANYLRVFKQSNKYTKVFTNKFNQVVSINPKRLWKKEKGLKKFASLFSDNFLYKLEQSSIAPVFPISKNIMVVDSNATNLLFFIQNTFSLNRNGKISFNYIYHKQQNNILLLTGIDKKMTDFNSFSLKLKFFKNFILINTLKTGSINAEYDFFSEKNYTINYNHFILNAKYNFPKTRIDFFYHYREKSNILGDERYYEHKFGIKSENSVMKAGKITMNANYINIVCNANKNLSVAYIMLEGLQQGNNFVWNLIYQHNISNGLQLNLMYDGRYSEGGKIIHTGNVQIVANL